MPKQSLAAWELVCKPKLKGGLGIVNFQKQNAALLIKFLDKFYNRKALPWVDLVWFAHYQGKVPHEVKLCGSFWWRDVMKQVDNFRGVEAVIQGKGDTLLFWSDNWRVNGSSLPLCQRYPRLFSYALLPNASLVDMYHEEDLESMFYWPLSVQAYQELGEVKQILQDNPLTQDNDQWVYIWGEHYASARFYKHIHDHIQVPGVYKWLWKSCCIMKHKVFAWLLISDRLNTRDLLKRRHWHVTDDEHCVLCPGRNYEDRIHLLFECNFSRRIWNYLQIEWVGTDDMQLVLNGARKSFAKPFFMEVVILACWNIWLLRNGKIFSVEVCSFTRWKGKFIHDISLLQYRIKRKHKDMLIAWIRSLP
jgi:hypothetical protein